MGSGVGIGHGLALGRDERHRQLRVQLCSGCLREAGQRLLFGQGLAVRPGGGHGREGIGNRQDPGDVSTLANPEVVDKIRDLGK